MLFFHPASCEIDVAPEAGGKLALIGRKWKACVDGRPFAVSLATFKPISSSSSSSSSYSPAGWQSARG